MSRQAVYREAAAEPGRPPAARRADTTTDAGETAMPPRRTHARDGDRRTPSFWSRSRTQHRLAPSPASRCPLVLARAANAAHANLRVEGPQVFAGPRPRSGRLPGCDRRAIASGERRGRTRPQARAECLRLTPLPRSRQSAPASRRRPSPSMSQQLATAGGTAGDAGSSTLALLGRRHAVIVALASDGSATRHARLRSGRCRSAGPFQIDRVPSSEADSDERDVWSSDRTGRSSSTAATVHRSAFGIAANSPTSRRASEPRI